MALVTTQAGSTLQPLRHFNQYPFLNNLVFYHYLPNEAFNPGVPALIEIPITLLFISV